MTTKTTTQAEQRNIISKLVNSNKDSNNKEFTTIRIEREVYNDLSKRGKWRDTYSDIIARLLANESKLEVPEDQRSF